MQGRLGQRGKGGWVNVPFARDRERLGYRPMSRVLYRTADGSWRTAEPGAGVSRLYTLKHGERWTLLDDDRVMVIHPDRPPKVVYLDGRVEEVTPTPLSRG
jgi:hypothetical protein